jgi:pimeloyl-ACP methyl ester carboxylesterase
VTLELEHEGGVLHVHDEGPRDGEPVVLLHGFPQDSSCWAEVVPHLHRSGIRTLAPDQRGYAPGAPHHVSAYRLGALAGDALAVLDAVGAERAHVVGHDWGGAVAWYLGAHHPERVSTLTVLSTPHPRALAGSMTRSLQLLRSWYTVAFQVPVLPELVLPHILGRTLRLSGLPADQADRYAARLGSPDALRGPLAWYRAAGIHPPWATPGGGQDSEGHPHRSSSADVVGVPTTYLWGRHDPVLGRAAAVATAEHVHGSDYLFLELDEGHWLPERRPEEVAGAVLDRVRFSGASHA